MSACGSSVIAGLLFSIRRRTPSHEATSPVIKPNVFDITIACQSLPPNIARPAAPRPLTFAVTPANGAWKVWSSAVFNAVYSLAVQNDRLWVANLYRQLAVYDGQHWRTFPTPGIGTVNCITDAPNGQLWFAGGQGVALYDPAQDNQP